MPKITAKAGEDFLVLPKDAVITVRVKSTKVEPVPGKDGRDPWDKIDFTFEIVDVANPDHRDAIGQTIFGGVGFKLTDHPDNRLRQWVEALLGIQVQEGFELDTDMLDNRTAKAIVDQYTKRNGSAAHKVGALIPSSTPTPTEAAQAAFGQTSAPASQPAPQQTQSDLPF